MKNIKILLIVIVSIIIQTHSLTLDNKVIRPLSRTISLLQQADCYYGTVEIDVKEGTSSNLTYNACFAKTTVNCTYSNCYNGWIANYHTVEGGLVEGYPKNRQTGPVFRLDINSAADYKIKKSQSLSQDFDRLIDIACSQFDPTVNNPRPTQKPTFEQQSTKVQDAHFQDSKISSNAQDLLDAKASTDTYIPEYSIKSQNDQISGTAKPQILNFIEDQGLTINRNFIYDSKTSNIIKRQDTINVHLSDTAVSASDDGSDTNPFDGKVLLTLTKRGKAKFSLKQFQALLNKNTKSFGRQQLVSKHISLAKDQVYVDVIDFGKPVQTQEVQANQINQKWTNQLKSSDSLDVIALKSGSSSLKSSTSSATSTTIFSKQTVLYQKTVLGKQIKVSILVEAKLTSNNQVLVITGTIKFNFFGKTKDIKAFQRTQNINFNWSYSNSISGNWGFDFYIPLPPPVSFMGVNLGFQATFTVTIKLSATGTPSVDVFTCKFIADAGASLQADVSAALRVIAIQGGVFIKGTLISVKTDPTLTLAYKYALKTLQVSLDWDFVLKAFQFKWGFFWKHLTWKGWSPKKIIKEWPVSNGIAKTYPVWNFSKTYNL